MGMSAQVLHYLLVKRAADAGASMQRLQRATNAARQGIEDREAVIGRVDNTYRAVPPDKAAIFDANVAYSQRPVGKPPGWRLPAGYNAATAARPLFGRALAYTIPAEQQKRYLASMPALSQRLFRQSAVSKDIKRRVEPERLVERPDSPAFAGDNEAFADRYGAALGKNMRYPGIYAHEYTHQVAPRLSHNIGGQWQSEIPAMISENNYAMQKLQVPQEELAAQTGNADGSWIYRHMLKHGPQMDPSTQQLTDPDKAEIARFAEGLYDPNTELGRRYIDWLVAKGHERRAGQ